MEENSFEKIMENSTLSLWSAYLDKKMELEDANDRIEVLERALNLAVSHICMSNRYLLSDDVYAILINTATSELKEEDKDE